MMKYQQEQHKYILGMLLIFLLYSYIYGNHNHLIKFLISLVIVIIGSKLYTYTLQMNKREKKESLVHYDFADIKRTLLIDEDIKWFEYNTFLVNYVQSMYLVIKYDKEILRDVIYDLNSFLKTYYIAVADERTLLYENVSENQHTLQKLDDLHDSIIDNLKNIVFILKINQYHDTINIPHKIEVLHGFLSEKEDLLAHKFKMKKALQKSL